jgi:hypothetical protein
MLEHAIRHAPMKVAQHGHDRLRRHALAQAGESDDVDEQDRQLRGPDRAEGLVDRGQSLDQVGQTWRARLARARSTRACA